MDSVTFNIWKDRLSEWSKQRLCDLKINEWIGKLREKVDERDVKIYEHSHHQIDITTYLRPLGRPKKRVKQVHVSINKFSKSFTPFIKRERNEKDYVTWTNERRVIVPFDIHFLTSDHGKISESSRHIGVLVIDPKEEKCVYFDNKTVRRCLNSNIRPFIKKGMPGLKLNGRQDYLGMENTPAKYHIDHNYSLVAFAVMQQAAEMKPLDEIKIGVDSYKGVKLEDYHEKQWYHLQRIFQDEIWD